MLALQIPELDQHLTVSINSKIHFESGIPNSDKPSSTSQILSFPPQRTNTIVIHLRNDYLKHGGLFSHIQIGEESNIIKKHYKAVIFKSILIGFLFFVCIFFTFLFLTKHPRGSSIYLTIAIFFFATRFLSSDSFVYTFFVNNPILKYRVNFISTYLACSFSVPFFYDFIKPNKFIKIIDKALFFVGLFFAFLTAVLPIQIISESVLYLSIYSLIMCFFVILIAIVNLFNKKLLSFFILLGGITGVFLTMNFLLNNKSHTLFQADTGDITITIFIVVCAFLLAQQISKLFTKEKALSSNLEKQVISRTNELNITIKKLELLSDTDSLTGIYNKRKFTELSNREISIHHRHKRPLSLIMFDIDLFKNINDTYGHKTGDEALKFLTSVCRQEIRGTDILGRIGGDEFALLLLETTNEEAGTIAENLRHCIHKYSKINNDIPDFTVSMGVITFRSGEILTEALERADKYLYKAKNLTRNAVQIQRNFSEDGLELLDIVDDK